MLWTAIQESMQKLEKQDKAIENPVLQKYGWPIGYSDHNDDTRPFNIDCAKNQLGMHSNFNILDWFLKFEGQGL